MQKTREVAEFLDGLLEKTGLEQERLAQLAGYSERTIKRVRSGEVELSERMRRNLKNAAQAFLEARAPNLETGPRAKLLRVLEAHGMSVAELGRRIGYDPGALEYVVRGQGRLKEAHAKRIVAQLPELTLEDLIDGSDHPMIVSESGMVGTYGATPKIKAPAGSTVRYVPLISWAQAGSMDAGHVDDAYEYEGIAAFDIDDRRAFAVEIRGDSMAPEINERDKVIVCPGWTPAPGDTVIVRTTHGDVHCKLWQRSVGTNLIFVSVNPKHPNLEIPRSEIAWIYPVGQVVKNLRRR